MLNKPKFKSCFHIEIVKPHHIFLLSENQYSLLNGFLYQQLVPLINGQHTVDELIDLMQPTSSVTEIYYALMILEKKGYIIENDENLPQNLATFSDFLNINIAEVVNRMQMIKVTVSTCGAVTAKSFISLLKSLNIQVQEDRDEESDIEVVLTDDYLHKELQIFNRKAWQFQRPWMLIKPVGTLLWIGPIFQPGQTGCWECLAQRLQANRPVESFIQRRQNISTPFPTSRLVLPSISQTCLNLAATEIVQWVMQGKNKKLEGILITLDSLSLETQKHILTQRPQCLCCGNKTQRIPTNILPVVLENRPKTFMLDGGHRSVSPEDTLKQYESHISPITGVVRELKSISQSDKSLMHSYIAGHNFATMSDDLYFLRENVRGRSGGKGKTDIQAKVSGLCEAIERYSGIFQGDEIRQKGSYQTMGDVAIHPNACMNFSHTQYQNRYEWNASCSSYPHKVPEPFDEEKKIEWSPIWSLTYKTIKYLPTAYCYYGYPKSPNPDCWADSNGNAAGNNREEAILQGFMELVERDSVALWWYNRLQKPAVNLDSFEEPYFQALKNSYQTFHRELWVLDITSDLNIPAFVAISRRIDHEIEDILLAFGAHFDPKLAIFRALTELNQMLPMVSVKNNDGSTQYSVSESIARDWWQNVTVNNQSYLLPDKNVVPKVFSDYPQLWSEEDLCEDVITCVKIAEKHNLEMLVLDQTRPDIGLNVVKVIVPGMRHFWKRLGPGRLYEVPIQLGLLSKPQQENQLNQRLIFF